MEPFETQKKEDKTIKTQGLSWFRIFTFLGGVISFITGIILSLGIIGGMSFGGGSILWIILPVVLIFASIDLINQKKWSLYPITATVIFLYYRLISNGYKITDGINLWWGLIIFIIPTLLIVYFWVNKYKFK